MIETVDRNHQNHSFDKCLKVLYNKATEKSSESLEKMTNQDKCDTFRCVGHPAEAD